MRANFMKMNDTKTEVMELHGFQPIVPPHKAFILDDDLDCNVTPSLSARNFGFYFDTKMNLDEQITNVTQKCYINLRNIGRLGSKLTHSLKIQLVHSMVLQILDINNASYGCCTTKQTSKTTESICKIHVWASRKIKKTAH